MKTPRSRVRLLAAFVAALGTIACSGTSVGADSPYIPVSGSAWRLALGDVNGDGNKELLCGLYHAALSCVNSTTGETLWERPLGGFPFAVAAADTNGDGKAESFAACADGKLYAFAHDGQPLWTYSPNTAAKYSVVVCRRGRGQAPLLACGGMDRTVHLLSASGKAIAHHDFKRAITTMVAGDVDQDGVDEIVVTSTRAGLYAILKLENEKLVVSKEHRFGEAKQIFESDGKPRNFNVYSLDVCDLHRNRRCAVVAGGEYKAGLPIRALSASGELLWTTPQLRGPDTRGFAMLDYYCMPLVRGGDVDTESSGGEVVVVTGGNVRILSGEGKTLAEANAPIGFTDLVLDGRTLYLGSSPNGDRTVYRIDLGGRWVSVVNGLQRQGLVRQIGETMQTILRQAKSLPQRDVTNSPSFRITLGASSLIDKNNWADPTADWFRSEFPYPEFTLLGSSRLSGMTQGLFEDVSLDHAGRNLGPNPKGVPAQTLVGYADGFERSRRKMTYYISHGCTPRITIDTLDKMLKAAPTALTGFVTHEDEDPSKVPDYCEKYLAPLAERCVAQGRSITMVEKNTFWFDTPSHPHAGPALFNPRNAAALIAGSDDANSRTPELNFFSRVGLRQAGLIRHIASYPIHDLLSFNRTVEWEYPKHGHPFFRLAVAHAVSGADCFDIRVNNFRASRLTAIGEEAFSPFLDLLGKGLIDTPRPDQLAGLSRLGFVVHHPPEQWLKESHNGHKIDLWQEDPAADRGVLPRNACYHGNTPTLPHSLSAVLFRKRRQFGCHIPATPYGLVAFVPSHTDLKKVVGVVDWWHTDGVSVWRDGGKKIAGEEAAAAIRKSFEDAADELPFRAFGDDVFQQTVRIAAGKYRLYFIDPGWLDPADRRVKVRIQAPGDFSVRDLLSDRDVPVTNRSFALDVPAGALRILEASRLER